MTQTAQHTLFIEKFELEIALRTGESKEFEYHYDGVTPQAEVEYAQGDQKVEWEGEQALNELLALFSLIEIRGGDNPLEVAGRALRALEVPWESVKEIELELKFSNGREVAFEYET